IALADAGDQRMKSKALELVQSQDQSHQVTGLKMMLRLGGVDEISTLANLAATSTGEAKLLARKCLYSISGKEFDTKITEEFVSSSRKKQEELILALGSRNVTASKGMLVDLMGDSDPRIRLAAIKSLAMIGDPTVISGMLANADQLTGAEQMLLVRSITVLTAYIPEPARRDDAVARALREATHAKTKTILINILGNVANEDAYQNVFPLLENDDPDVRVAAIHSLSEWPNDRPLVALADYFLKAQDDQMKLLALRGVERLTNISDSLSADERAKLLIKTLNACKTDDERKIVLSGLGKTGSLITFEAAIKLVSSKAVGSEAEAAILQNIRNIDRDDFSAEIKQYLRLAQEKSSNENFKKEIDKWLSDLS
ncbi:MAG: HEAT repeat domain-containing protein, partial [Cyclobacteriaceae bacterium]|nr:HEAT repeat domain-containing protein [Cyclobacteriaceae bacterium SS2]